MQVRVFVNVFYFSLFTPEGSCAINFIGYHSFSFSIALFFIIIIIIFLILVLYAVHIAGKYCEIRYKQKQNPVKQTSLLFVVVLCMCLRIEMV